jgi:TolB-like protein
MVTGNPAFQGANIHQILSSIVGPQSPPEITGVPRELISIIFKALVKDPEQRFKSSRQMLQELQSLTLDSPRTAPPPPEEDISIIVVPFSARQEDLDLSAGITDGIIDRISRIRKLRVMSRSVSMKYLGQNPDLLGLGHEMNVRLSLTGSIRRSGERARVIAQLVSNRDGFQIWSERFDFLIRDIFDGEDEISAAVSASIKNYFTRDKEDSAFSLPPASRTDRAASTAQEHYLSALYHLGSYREEDIRKAIDLFKNAIVADPGFSAAYAKLSEACMMMHWSMGNPDSQEFIVLGQEAASRALEIDPANLEAQVSIALSEMNGMQLASSKERLEKVLAQSPNHTGALSWLSYLYTSVGKAGQGEAAARKAVMREPNNANHYIWLSYAQLSQGKYPEAADALDRSVRIDPRNPYAYSLLLFVQLAQGRMTEARLIFDYLEKYGENKPLPEVMKQIYRLKAGLPPASMDCLQMEKLAMDPEAVRLMADVFALAGDREKMMEMLEACAAMGLSNLPFLQTDPFLDEYREDGSFQAMIRRVEQAAGHEGSTMSLARPRAWTN